MDRISVSIVYPAQPTPTSTTSLLDTPVPSPIRTFTLSPIPHSAHLQARILTCISSVDLITTTSLILTPPRICSSLHVYHRLLFLSASSALFQYHRLTKSPQQSCYRQNTISHGTNQFTIHGTSKRTKSKSSCSINVWYSPASSSTFVFVLFELERFERGARYAK